jgi:hypothetical protein
MIPDPSSPQVREAAEELQLYLSDILPPLVVADAFKLLIKYPPSLVASRLREWTSSQYRPGGEINLSDYITYAMRKVNVMGEFRLVPLEPFDAFLEALKGLVLDFCPVEERETLRENLTRLSETSGTLTGSVDSLIRRKSGPGETPAAAAGGPPLSAEEVRGLRRFSLLLLRIAREMSADDPAEPRAPGVLAHALAAAARTSRSPEEFEQNLEKLREVGLGGETADMFRTLGNNLPGWIPPEPRPEAASAGAGGEAGGAGTDAPAPSESGPVAAMHRIVAQPEDPGEVARRFNAMVKSALEQFNAGALPQAVTVLALAERIVAEKRVDAATVEAVKHMGDEAIDFDRVRKYAEVQRFHGMLRRVLAFFTATSPKGLLAELLREPKRERRRLILQLLEVHGTPTREEALERLRSPFGQGEGDEKWYFRRNLLYLLRRIPPARDDSLEEDVDRAVRHAVVRFPASLVKEAVANLGQLKHERAESALLSLLETLERMLIRPAGAAYDPREARLLLDRVVAALARFGTTGARRAVVDHGLRKKSELGDTMARLSELSGQDLSEDSELVERLLAALKSNAPRKVLGMVLHSNDQNARHLVEALSTTPSPAVQEALEDLARRFPELEIGKAASSALASLDAAAHVPDVTADTRSGEVELFGLPALMQNLSGSGLSGTLTLKDAQGEITSEIELRGGKMKSCETGALTGEEAFCQLLERPAPGSYLITMLAQAEAQERGEDVSSFKEIDSICREGMRRYDEFQQTSAVIPDDVRLKATNVRPEHYPEELDGIFVNGLWKLVSTGSTPLECEATVTADAFRIRRQIAHWVESGALTGA